MMKYVMKGGSNTLFGTVIFIVAILLFLIFNSTVYGKMGNATAMGQGFHIVVKGDTLYQLAKQYWGDGKLYPQLAKLNKIENPDLIHVGQKIWFADPLTEREKIRVAEEVVWKKMVRTFKIIHGRTFDTPNTSRAWALQPLQIIDKGMPTPQIRDLFREAATRLEWTDLTLIHKSIVAEADTVEDILVLASIADHESDFRNVKGKYGEIGPLQVMPETGIQVLEGTSNMPETSLSEQIADILWDIPTNVWAGWSHFKYLLSKTGGDVYNSLRKYNGHGEPTKIYAGRVMAKLGSYVAQYNRTLQETMGAKIADRNAKWWGSGIRH